MTVWTKVLVLILPLMLASYVWTSLKVKSTVSWGILQVTKQNTKQSLSNFGKVDTFVCTSTLSTTIPYHLWLPILWRYFLDFVEVSVRIQFLSFLSMVFTKRSSSHSCSFIRSGRREKSGRRKVLESLEELLKSHPTSFIAPKISTAIQSAYLFHWYLQSLSIQAIDCFLVSKTILQSA